MIVCSAGPEIFGVTLLSTDLLDRLNSIVTFDLTLPKIMENTIWVLANLAANSQADKERILSSVCFENIFMKSEKGGIKNVEEALCWLYSNCIQGIDGAFLSYSVSKRLLAEVLRLTTFKTNPSTLNELFYSTYYYLGVSSYEERMQREKDILDGDLSGVMAMASTHIDSQNSRLQTAIILLLERLSNSAVSPALSLCDAHICSFLLRATFDSSRMDSRLRARIFAFFANMIVYGPKQRRAVTANLNKLLQAVSEYLIVGETECRIACLQILKNYLIVEDSHEMLDEFLRSGATVPPTHTGHRTAARKPRRQPFPGPLRPRLAGAGILPQCRQAARRPVLRRVGADHRRQNFVKDKLLNSPNLNYLEVLIQDSDVSPVLADIAKRIVCEFFEVEEVDHPYINR